MKQHKSNIREAKDKRRADLIRATLDCVIESGLQNVTVREVAARAGVTNGLIRHYFKGKDQLIHEAYRTTMKAMTASVRSAVEAAGSDPTDRLYAFVVANQNAPVLDARNLSLWASFISLTHIDPVMAEIHRETYLEFRRSVEPLVAAICAKEGRPISATQCQRYAIQINALIDGLWLEGCLAKDLFDEKELAEISIRSVEDILGLPLTAR